jgi:hypothetical protein
MQHLRKCRQTQHSRHRPGQFCICRTCTCLVMGMTHLSYSMAMVSGATFSRRCPMLLLESPFWCCCSADCCGALKSCPYVAALDLTRSTTYSSNSGRVADIEKLSHRQRQHTQGRSPDGSHQVTKQGSHSSRCPMAPPQPGGIPLARLRGR